MIQDGITLLSTPAGGTEAHITLKELTNVPTIACDCLAKGIETIGDEVPWGWRLGHSVNIDHHAPVDAMAREISSTNLALRYVEAQGPADPSTRVLITHTDCDSILSAGLITGDLDPHPEYGEAALAADHTGEPNDIADLLQALMDERDIHASFIAMAMQNFGWAVPPRAQVLLNARRRKREQAEALVGRGGFEHLGAGIYFAQFTEDTEGEFFPRLLPHARLIVLGMPHPKYPEAKRWLMRCRRGHDMPEGEDLRHLGLEAHDPAYGGRWNAGSNKRGGGTSVEPRVWAEGLVEGVARK